MQVFQCNRANFNQARVIDTPSQPLSDGQIRMAVERFSFTANNITYAVMGDIIKYWSFFPTRDQDGNDISAEWGHIPVWGFATVTESNTDEVTVGERFFGYFPPADECVMQPSNVAHGSFIDGSEHRARLPAGYNVYRSAPRTADQSGSQSNAHNAHNTYNHQSNDQADNERSMLYPLFVTAYCIHDMLAERAWHEAAQVLVISASSKTSIGVAYAMKDDQTSPKSVGLTSSRNLKQVEKLGLYDEVCSYEQIQTLDPNIATLIVDMSGNKALISQLHQHFGDAMKLTLNVGITHWGDLNDTDGINTERSEQFFAPSQIQSMIKRMGPQGFQANSGKFISESAVKTRSWLHCNELKGLGELAAVYNDVCDGNIDANTGLIIRLV